MSKFKKALHLNHLYYDLVPKFSKAVQTGNYNKANEYYQKLNHVHYLESQYFKQMKAKRRRKPYYIIIGVLIAIVANGSLYTIHSLGKKPIRQHEKVTQSYRQNNNYISHKQLSLQLPQNKINVNFPKIKAKSAIAIDADTGKILYQHNANQPRRVASLAKLMTVFLVEQKIRNSRNPNIMNHYIDPSVELRNLSYTSDLGGFKFKKHHYYTIRQLIQATMIESSNNAAIALGQWVGGTDAHFVAMMNEQAKAWHLNARFVSISGLENNDLSKYHLIACGSKHSANMVSAKDMSIIARHLIKSDPHILSLSKKRSMKVDGQTLTNENQLLRPGSKVDGLKTGFTDSAGMCFVCTERPSVKQDRIIVVMLHDNNDFNDSKNLMSALYKSRALNKESGDH